MFNAGQHVTDTNDRLYRVVAVANEISIDIRERKFFKTLKHFQIVNLFRYKWGQSKNAS